MLIIGIMRFIRGGVDSDTRDGWNTIRGRCSTPRVLSSASCLSYFGTKYAEMVKQGSIRNKVRELRLRVQRAMTRLATEKRCNSDPRIFGIIEPLTNTRQMIH